MTTTARYRLKYVTADYLAVNAAWLIFNIIRFYSIDINVSSFQSLGHFLKSPSIILGQVLVPITLVCIFALSGYYNKPLRRSGVDELVNTLSTTFVGMLLIYFVALINDDVPERLRNYELMGMLWMLLAAAVYIPRRIIGATIVKKIHNGHIALPTIIIGKGPGVHELERRIGLGKGMHVIDVVKTAQEAIDIAATRTVRNIVIMSESLGQSEVIELINRLFPLNYNLYITPDMYRLVTGGIRVGGVVEEPLINISEPAMSPMTANLKRVADIAISAVTLVVISPLLLAIAIAIKATSRGPVIYSQERIGYHKRPFRILKFRSMKTDAEPNGPVLSGAGDPRVTRVGHFLRKYRLDELPQFVNVIRGDMSLVGPRPERAYYVEKIVERAPYYYLIHRVRPGITSWGMVKYGYAYNVEGMIERMRYDLIYLENVSMAVDIKILFHTVHTVITGKGI